MIGLDRRTLLAAAGLGLLLPASSRGGTRKSLTLELVSRDLALRPGQKATLAWRFADDVAPRFAQGDEVDVTIINRLPVEAFVVWRGLDGAPALEPLLARGPIAAGGVETFALNLRHAGTVICDARIGGGDTPLPVLPIVVTEKASFIIADKDEVLLIEDWRPKADDEPLYTLNGQTGLKLLAGLGERRRFRVINGAQRAVLAVEFSGINPFVIGIDGQPSELFPARDGRVVLAPGTRVDSIADVSGPFTLTLHDGRRRVTLAEWTIAGTQVRDAIIGPIKALPANGLPERIELRSALRETLDLGRGDGWTAAEAITPRLAPTFKVAKGRSVVLTLNNPGEATAIFHLHGHHMRLLDRLDDGWKPFWLDTVAVPAKQTMRVAFSATNPGAYLMETYKAEWTSARGFRSYLVMA